MLFNAGMFILMDRERCLNDQHNGVGCRHCVSHCPGEALNLENNQIELEKEKCLGCGLCLSDCPTGVFYSKQWDEKSVLTEVKKQGAPVTQFFCEFNDEPYLNKEDKEKGAIQIPACLSSLSKGAWYEIGLLTNVELRLEKCQECKMKSCLDRLQYSVATATEWLTASGHTPAFKYIEDVKKIYKKKKLKAVSTGMKVTSRRDLFLTLFGHRRRSGTKGDGNEKSCIAKKKKEKGKLFVRLANKTKRELYFSFSGRRYTGILAGHYQKKYMCQLRYVQ